MLYYHGAFGRQEFLEQYWPITLGGGFGYRQGIEYEDYISGF